MNVGTWQGRCHKAIHLKELIYRNGNFQINTQVTWRGWLSGIFSALRYTLQTVNCLLGCVNCLL